MIDRQSSAGQAALNLRSIMSGDELVQLLRPPSSRFGPGDRQRASLAVESVVREAASAIQARYTNRRRPKDWERRHTKIANRTRKLIDALEGASPHVQAELWDHGARWAIPNDPALADFLPPEDALRDGVPHIVVCLRRLEVAAERAATQMRSNPGHTPLDLVAHMATDVFQRFRPGQGAVTHGGDLERFAVGIFQAAVNTAMTRSDVKVPERMRRTDDFKKRLRASLARGETSEE